MRKFFFLIIFILLISITLLFIFYGKNNRNNKSSDNVFLTSEEPEVVELGNGEIFDLVADFIEKEIDGKIQKMFAYNGSIPGPVIKVKQGSEIVVNFTNNTDIENTIHSHGLRLDNQFDGVPDLTQESVKPGETFTYTLKFPDPGIYWYHPHVREDYTQELGLYGNFIVEPEDTNYWSPVNQEIPLFLDDIRMENNKITAFDKDLSTFTLMGRFGNTMLINGSENYSLNVNKNEVIRFYITNSANTRVFRFKINGVKMKLVGGDNGKYEKETFVDSVIISPSERYIIEALFSKSGDFNIENSNDELTTTLGKVNVSNNPTENFYINQFNILRTNTDIIEDIDNFREYFYKTPDKRLKVNIDIKGMMGGMENMPCHAMGGMVMGRCTTDERTKLHGEVVSNKIEWEDDMEMMNIMSTTKNVQWEFIDEDTGKTNMDIDWKFKVGDKVKIKIFNDPNSDHPMQHPIHVHGQRFLVLSTNGEISNNLVWKDSVLVPTGDTVEILIDVTNPGKWMGHCHIAEHLEDGMMFEYTVEE